MKNTKKRMAGILLVLLFSLIQIFTAAAAPSSAKVIRVGFFKFAGYHDIDEYGNKSGYGYDFVQMMARFDNDTYEFLGYDHGWKDMMTMLDHGDIDLLTNVAKTPEREKKYLYSEKTIGNDGSLFTVRDDNSTVITGDYKTYEGLTLGSIKDSVQVEEFKNFAGEHDFTYTMKTYETETELRMALASGEVDGIISIGLRNLQHEKVIEQISKSDMYVICRKNDTELMSQINRAIDRMDQESSNWRSELFDKYYQADQGSNISFLADELEYIQSLKKSGTPLRVCANPDRRPYSYYENGAITGIIPRIFQEAAKRIGIDYEFVVAKNRQEYKDLLASGEIDACLDLTDSVSEADDAGYKLTDPYLSASVARVVRADFKGEEKKTAILGNLDLSERDMDQLLKNMTADQYDSTDACIRAVIDGKADSTYVYAYAAQIALNRDPVNHIRMNILMDYGSQFSIGVPKTRDYHLVAILNKGISSIENEYIQNIITDETDYLVAEIPLGTYLRENPLIIVTAAALLLLAAAVAALTWVRMNNMTRMKAQEEKARIQLEGALKEAQEASAAKGQFMSRMSHEIRTPLNAVIGYMTIAQMKDSDDEKIRHCLENSELAAKHLLSIINDVLDMSAIESGRIKIANVDYNLKQQISTISTIFYTQAKNRDVDFQVRIRDLTEEWVLGDQLRVNQVLMNLLSNAVKFTPGGGHIVLEVTQLEKKESQVSIQFKVSDTGIGMSKEYLSRIFTPFEQESSTTAQKYGGTGLGLSISKNLTGLMKGQITVDSRQDQGTVFTVVLPFGISAKNSLEKKRYLDLTKLRVLAVDDQKEEQNYLKLVFKQMGVKCDLVSDGETAVRRFTGRQNTDYAYDLCILDWKMPGMGGIETARQLRKAGGEGVPILIATAYDVTEIENEAKAAGVDQVIAKPLFASTLMDLFVNRFGSYEPEACESAAASVDLQGATVLLAEDNEMNMEIAVSILSKAGVQVETAENGKLALDRFEASTPGHFTAILMDIQMPVMNGYEAARAIRACSHPQAKTIPIIAMTANAFTSDVEEALQNGMNGHIAKPVDYEKLYRTLGECLT